MPAELPKPDPIVIVAYLDDVDGELEAARRLSEDPPSRFAPFHSPSICAPFSLRGDGEVVVQSGVRYSATPIAALHVFV